jgi:hypothetical protein
MTKRVRDAELKAMILRSVQAGNRKSRQIYNSINYDGYDNFKSELSMLKRRGYLSRRGKPPYDWVLTKKGLKHANDPYISLRKRQAAIEHIRDSFLEDDERFEEALADWVRRHPESPMVQHVLDTKFINQDPQFIVVGDEKYDSERVREIEEKNKTLEFKNAKNKEEIDRLNIVVSGYQKQQRKEIKTENAIMEDRRELINRYRDRALDYEFFEKLGFFPYHMGHTKLGNRGSVELLRPGEVEVNRDGHVKGMLSPDMILKGDFRITYIANSYIKISGFGMKKPKEITFVSQKMMTQTDVRTGKKKKVPRGTGQIVRVRKAE